MKNELVKETKKMSRDIYNSLVTRHAESKVKGEDASVRSELVADMKEAIRIYKTVNEENVEELHASAINLLNAVEIKYGLAEEEIPEIEESEEEVPEIEETTTEETALNEEKKRHARTIAIGAVGLSVLGGITVHSLLEAKKLRANNETETIEETETPVRVVTETPEDTATIIIDETPAEQTEIPTDESQLEAVEEHQLVLGEYGTFFDVTDEEQVNARAQYIIDTYYAPFMDQLSEQERSIITRENIANVIRVMGGEFPLDMDGNPVMDANIVDKYGQMFTVLVGDLGSSPQLEGRYYNIPAHMFTTDGTELSEFVREYDESYQTITNGFNKAADERLEGVEVTGGTMVREGIAELGTKYWNEWVMQGIYGDVNPFNFEPKDRLFAYLSSFAKYGQYAYEYNLNSMQAVCVRVCVNAETKEMNEIPVNKIFVGYTSGQWDTVIAKSAGIETTATPDSIYFTQDLFDELNWKYSNLQQLKLR